MADLHIETLTLRIEDAGLHSYRLQPIALRALDLLSQQIDARCSVRPGRLDLAGAGPVELDLANQNDEQAAEAIASAWLQAIVLRQRS